MSRLRELMEELCPGGVEYKKLGEFLSRHTGMAITAGKMKELHIPNGEIRIFAAGNTFADVRESDIDKSAVIREPGIIVKSHGNIGFEYYTKPFSHKNEMWSYTCGDNATSLKYVYYMLEKNATYFQNKAKTGKLPQISIVDTENYEIPVPPLEIQNEIVKLLDNFTELTAELTAELTLRKKQYNFYRDSLLNFVRVDDTIVQTDRQTDRQVQRISKFGRRIQKDVVWRTLGDIGTVCMCKRILKQQTNTESGIPFYKIGTFGKTADSYISEELFAEYKAKYSYPRKGEILISAAGTIGRSVIYDGSPAYFQDSNIVWIANDESVVLNRYLYYFYSLFPWRVAEGGTVARLYNDQIQRTEIPVPPLEVQQKIVSILDRFDALCNDLTNGLPAEIAARKKQYEYYRDKLLTFPRAQAEGSV